MVHVLPPQNSDHALPPNPNLLPSQLRLGSYGRTIMRILRGFSTHPSQPLTSPFLPSNGIFIELRGGDFCDPVQIGGNWFTPPYPSRVLRFFLKYPIIPFISYRIGNRAGYIGAKAYGVDSEAYKNWMKPEEVYDGSYALCFSMRPFATMKD